MHDMFKTLLLFCYTASFPVLATDLMLSPIEAIERFGSFTVSDGSSYFTFLKGGSFDSGPIEESRRAMKGRWAKDDNLLVATVKLGWVNGITSGNDYRRMVFYIPSVSRTEPPKFTAPVIGKHMEIFAGYFIIDEMTKIPKPAKGFDE